MTEDDARKKWCPFFRPVIAPGFMSTEVIMPTGRTIIKDGGKTMVQDHCIASDCMAWRWILSPSYVEHQNANCSGPKLIVQGECGLTAVQP